MEDQTARALIKALQKDGVKIPQISEILFGDRSGKHLNALRNYTNHETARPDIRALIYEKAPILWKKTTSEAAHKIISNLISEDGAPVYSNQLRQNYGATVDDLKAAGAKWEGTYIGYRQDPHTAQVIKTTLKVNDYRPDDKGISYTHFRHDTNVYEVQGWLVPTSNTYCFFGQTYRRDHKDNVRHGGAITIFVNRFTSKDTSVWRAQELDFRQGLMLISLPDQTYPAFSTRVLFLRVTEDTKNAAFAAEWSKPKGFKEAAEEIDAALARPDEIPNRSIGETLLSNAIGAPEDCLLSYRDPAP